MPQRVSVELEDAALREALARLIAALAAPRAVFDQIGRYLASAAVGRFERERGPDGEPWRPSIRALAEGGQTLTDFGTLRRSITHQIEADGRGALIGSNLAYAAIHQFGGRAGRGHAVTLPARPYLGISPQDRTAVLRIVSRALQKAAGP